MHDHRKQETQDNGLASSANRRRSALQGYGAFALLCTVAAGCQGPALPEAQQRQPLFYEKMFPTYKSTTAKYNVGIVGGGTAGLLVAWNLRRLGHSVTVYDNGAYTAGGTNNWGGNVRTIPLTLQGKNNSGVMVNRWADAGVNDFNTKTYRYITFMLDRLGVGHLPLEDSAMWGNAAGQDGQPLSASLYYQTDSSPYKGNLSAGQLANIASDSSYFFTNAFEIATNSIFAEMTVDEYLAYKANLPAGDPNRHVYSPEFINYNLKARISNMYFTDENEPGLMPARGILFYYILQEGLSPLGAHPDRRYFADGASAWINALMVNQLSAATPTPGFPELPSGAAIGPPVTFKPCATVSTINVAGVNKIVNWNGSAATGCSGATGGSATHQKIVLASHAKGTQDILNASTSSGTGIPQALIDAVNKIQTGTSNTVIHQYNGVADNLTQDNINDLRTYNIYVYPGYVNTYPLPATPPSFNRPYTISYIENRHQDDAHSPKFSVFPQPQFYTTVEPRMADLNTLTPYILTRADTGTPATNIILNHQFMHKDPFVPGYYNGKDTPLAQRIILGDRNLYPGLQNSGGNGLYIGGGWVRGAGLQEECFLNRSSRRETRSSFPYPSERFGKLGRRLPLSRRIQSRPLSLLNWTNRGPDYTFSFASASPCTAC